MNSVLLIFSSIVNVIATAISDPKITGNAPVPAWAGYLNLASQLANLGASAAGDLAALNDQLIAAVAGNRGLTAQEIAAWKARDDIAEAKIEAYLQSASPSGSA